MKIAIVCLISNVVIALTLMLLLSGLADARAVDRARLKLQIANVESVYLEASATGYAYVVAARDGSTTTMSPDEFAGLIHRDLRERPWWQRALNITSAIGIAWVALGFAGQALFTGRMIVQWLASERKGASTVPAAFWWLGLGGATVLLTYFIWRKDIVGIVGQGMGWIIYFRNLVLIHKAEGPLARC